MKNLVYFGKICIALWFIVISLDVPSVDAQSCDPRCKFPHKCQADIGKCLCVVGFTGPNAFYIEGNHVLADFCNRPCFYNIFFQNSECAATTTTPPSTTTTTSTSTITTPINNTTAPRRNTTMPKTNTTTAPRTNVTMQKVNSTMPKTNFTNFTFPNINVTVSPTKRNGSIPLVPSLVDQLCKAIEQLQYVKHIFQKLFG